jgi:RND family efflux transporter MFP subunit
MVSIDPAAAQGQVSQTEGALAQAQAALALAQRNFERFRALASTDSASELELDQARMQYEQAQGAVQQARGAVTSATSVASESQVMAPFDGRVVSRLVEVGDLAAPGRPLVMVESEQGRQMVLSVPEALTLSGELIPGKTVVLSLDATPAQGRFEGTVAELSPGPDPVTHSYTVKIDLPIEVAAGSAGRAWIATGEVVQLLIPASGLMRSGGLDLVVVRGDEDRAQTRVVTVGLTRPDGTIEVLSGLAGDETIALGLGSPPAAGSILIGSTSEAPHS